MYTLKSYTGLLFLLVFSIGFHLNAQKNSAVEQTLLEQTKTQKKKKKKKRKGRQPKIDLSHWKVTLPVTNDQGKPYEIEPQRFWIMPQMKWQSHICIWMIEKEPLFFMPCPQHQKPQIQNIPAQN